ncbi:DUF6153 family protein [Streptomyces sp. NPDC018693]|uniref:DUF6153 family protein n=1 Tax=Streptomyces sp. NPDC018693 TaxID=3365051 RepID=UPI0037A7A9F9
MTGRTAQLRSPRSPRGRWRAALLLGLALGLLAMCGLSSVGAGAQRSYDHSAQARTAVDGGHHSAHTVMAVDGGHPSAHTGTAMGGDAPPCHRDGGPADHADAGCASGAVGTGPVLPAPLPDPAGTLPPAHGGPGVHAPHPDDGRAPPTLAELQLLRI